MSGKKGQTGTAAGRTLRRKDLKPAKAPGDAALLRSAAQAAKKAEAARARTRRAEEAERAARRSTP
jgi:hypothetical protein